MIIFDKNGDLFGVFSDLPNESYLDESKWSIAELPEGERFDPNYKYSCVDGVAVKGDLIPEDLEEKARIKAEFDATKYQRDRLQEYPSIQELVVALYDEEDKQAIIEKRNAVKAKYPKPE